jgi:aquaporin related protein
MAAPNMQEQGSGPSALPVYYGERMQDGSIIESPHAPYKTESRDALLRLPIQPGDAHLHNPEILSPVSPIPLTGSLNPNIPFRTGSKRVAMSAEPTRYITYPQEDYRHQSRRYERDPYEREPAMYRGAVARQPQVEEYYEEEDRPQPYRRPVRRYARPPLSHKQMPGGPGFHARGSSESGRQSTDRFDRLDYEPDTPSKPRYQYYDESGDESPRPPRSYYAASGRGGRGPPNNKPPSTQEVMRIPWTMWMNSSAKNRKQRPRPKPHLRSTLTPQCPILSPFGLFGGPSSSPPSAFPVQPSILTLL